jgi:hypothetical protein
MGNSNNAPPPADQNRTMNCTTVAYAINQIGLSNSGGTHENAGSNIPLSSMHPGGVNILRADATVGFLTNSTTPLTIALMCTRNDGQTFNDPSQ